MSERMRRHYVLLGLWVSAYQSGVSAARVRGWKYTARYRRYVQLSYLEAAL